MQSKHIGLLAGLTVVTVAVALFATKSGDADTTAASEKGAFLPTFGESINDVNVITVAKSGQTVTLEKQGDTWGVAERGGYPANFTKVRDLLRGLNDLEIESKKTKIAANYSKLGVEDVAADSSSAGLTVAAGDQVLCDLIVGNSKPLGRDQGLFVRKRGEEQSWEVRGPRITLPSGAIDWMEREILRLESDKVETVLIQHADGETVKVERAARDSSTFVVANVPPGRAEKREGVGNAVATSLSYFQMDDVKPVGEVDFDAEPVALTTFKCYDGLVIDVTLAKVEDTTWAKVATSFVAPPAPPAPAEGEEPAPAPETIAQADVDALQAKVDGWAFAIPSFKADALAHRMEDLLAELVPETPAPLLPGGESLIDGLDTSPVTGEQATGTQDG